MPCGLLQVHRHSRETCCLHYSLSIIIIIVVVVVVVIIIIILVIAFMQDIYDHIPDTNHISMVYSVAAVL
jgi:hypothetical protein